MPKRRKCATCGNEFLSCRNIKFCSEKCRETRKKRCQEEADERRRDGISGKEKMCPVCGKTFLSHRNIKFCGENCRKIQRKRNLKENNKVFYIENKERILEKAKKRKEKENERNYKERV